MINNYETTITTLPAPPYHELSHADFPTMALLIPMFTYSPPINLFYKY